MSATEARPRAGRPPRAPVAFGTITVIGGGCYGSYYVRQLRRGAAAGAIAWDRLVVVDRDAACAVAAAARTASAGGGPRLEVEIAEWGAHLTHVFDAACDDPSTFARDAVVPSPLMPHLTAEWLLHRARLRWPERDARILPLAHAPDVPWERAGADGRHYVSFATWTCPVNCVEPERCPAIRGERSWTMPDALRAFVAAERSRGAPLAGPALFHCTHRAFGVGMFDVAEAVAADAMLAGCGGAGKEELLVASVSHCHGALARLVVGA